MASNDLGYADRLQSLSGVSAIPEQKIANGLEKVEVADATVGDLSEY